MVADKILMHEMEEDDAAPIHGDLLEVILSHVPLIDLVLARRVSKSWNDAVVSSLSNFKKAKPWLLVHVQKIMSSCGTTTHAYDARSQLWVKITQPSIKHASDLQSSNGDLLYILSPTKLSFSVDPLHATWQDVSAPRVWRVDPIVALVGSRIVVAGGASEFEDDPLVVETYDVERREWTTCQSMPAILKDAAAPTWLSVAANEEKMFVTEKTSGITYSFSPDSRNWQGPFDLRPNPQVFFLTVGFSGDDMILAGLVGHAQDVMAVRLWKVDPETMGLKLIGEMPTEFVQKLKDENSNLSSISLSSTKDFVYVYNSSEAEEIVLCEFADNGACRWESVRNPAWRDACKVTERMVFSCGKVEIEDLERAMRSANRKFSLKCCS
ncbi:hypothetical protein Nepgr_003424 [Nepenthes gracilis]|uniref:F-box domain-containing protein n=1 Tax=Nepenthes gracilis TaxID=150966 RepID=A0AAD3RZJ1_NEPGR|nr:hypothetical protein Nepgr_003424 [Nepenthes gracilis]